MSLKDIRSNPLMLTDDYNLSHQKLKINTDWEISHIYNRDFPMVLYGFNETVINTLNITINVDMIKEADFYAKLKGEQFPVDLFLRLLYKTGGKIPLIVEALPDGTWIPANTPFAQIRNSVEGFGELVTWFEALLLHARFASQCATRALGMRKYLEEQRKINKYDESFLYRFHSFGFRGHRSLEDAYWAGTAWNLFLRGTDDFHSIRHTQQPGPVSISALAHKVVQQFDNEKDCYFRAIDQAEASGEKIIAIVIDTYDANEFIITYLTSLLSYAKNKGIKLVFRPDSGDVIQQTETIYHLACLYGGYRAGEDVAVIIGEDMSFAKAIEYDKRLHEGYYKIPLNFINYGIGEGYYKDFDRASSGWSMKTCYSNGKPRMKFAVPTKQSIPGVVKLVEDYEDTEKVMKCLLQTEYEKLTLPGTSLYTTPYLYNPDPRLKEPIQINLMPWFQIKVNCDKLLNKNSLQERIILSDGINNLTEELRLQHIGKTRIL